MNKGYCEIINNNWKCTLKVLEFKYFDSLFPIKINSHSTVSFNLNENKLIIPVQYFYPIVMKRNGEYYDKYCQMMIILYIARVEAIKIILE